MGPVLAHADDGKDRFEFMMNNAMLSVFGNAGASRGGAQGYDQTTERSLFGEELLSGASSNAEEEEGNYSALTAFGFITSGALPLLLLWCRSSIRSSRFARQLIIYSTRFHLSRVPVWINS